MIEGEKSNKKKNSIVCEIFVGIYLLLLQVSDTIPYVLDRVVHILDIHDTHSGGCMLALGLQGNGIHIC